MRGYLDTVRCRPTRAALRGVWPSPRHGQPELLAGLFHCYVRAGPAWTNNEPESRFRDTRCRLLRTTGQKGLAQRTLNAQGALEILPRPRQRPNP